MSLSTTDAVGEVYRVALQDALARRLVTDPEWDRYKAIVQEAAERIDAEREAFRRDYQVRLSEARQVVLREHTARQLNLQAPRGVQPTPPSPEKLDIVAMNRVQIDHDQRIAAIRRDEIDAYRALRTEIVARETRQSQATDRWQGRFRESFNRTNAISPHDAQVRTRSGPSQS
ncbi:MAG: hypothetical protein AAF416_22935 [Pseudomonadota bacterium]